MLTTYIQAAMRHAHYEILEDNTYYGEIPGCRAFMPTKQRLRLVARRCRRSWKGGLFSACN